MQLQSNPLTEEQLALRSCIQKVATGPEYSKDLSYEEAYNAMRLILSGDADQVQAGVFLIALRMKRETQDENKGVLQAIVEATDRVTVDVDELVDVADPYDGYARSIPPSPFLPAVLAALGIPAVSHGVATMGPKYGVTHHRVLKTMGLNVDLTTQQAAENLLNPDLGWAYVDQKHACPALYQLTDLRTRIVKRPCLTTVEVLINPLRAKSKTHLLTGYVHKPYPPIYTDLARFVGFDSAMIVRGVEGGIIPSLKQPAKVFHFMGSAEDQDWDIDPGQAGIEQDTRAVQLPESLAKGKVKTDDMITAFDAEAAAEMAVENGLAALSGKKGVTYDALVYVGAITLTHLGRAQNLNEGAQQVRQVLDSGAARARIPV